MATKQALSDWLNELRDKAAKSGYDGDLVADAGAEEWAEFYYDGYSVDQALSDYFKHAASSWNGGYL